MDQINCFSCKHKPDCNIFFTVDLMGDVDIDNFHCALWEDTQDNNSLNKVILSLKYLGYDPPETISDQIDLYEDQADMIKQGIQHSIGNGMIDILCEKHGISLRKLAKIVKVSPSYLSQCNNGKEEISFSIFRKLERMEHE